MSKQRCQFETTSTEFLDWQEYLDRDINEFHRIDYYLAQIAQEIRKTAVKHPESVKLENFLKKFEKVKPPKKLTREEVSEKSKKRWLGWAGLGHLVKNKGK